MSKVTVPEKFVDYKIAYQSCLDFIKNEMSWCYFRQDFLESTGTVSENNAQKLKVFLKEIGAYNE